MWCQVEALKYKVQALAVERRLRGQGGAAAQECLRHVLEAVESHAVDVALQLREHQPIVDVYAWIDGRNWPSQTLFRKTGFSLNGSVDENLSEWNLRYPLAAIDN